MRWRPFNAATSPESLPDLGMQLPVAVAVTVDPESGEEEEPFERLIGYFRTHEEEPWCFVVTHAPCVDESGGINATWRASEFGEAWAFWSTFELPSTSDEQVEEMLAAEASPDAIAGPPGSMEWKVFGAGSHFEDLPEHGQLVLIAWPFQGNSPPFTMSTCEFRIAEDGVSGSPWHFKTDMGGHVHPPEFDQPHFWTGLDGRSSTHPKGADVCQTPEANLLKTTGRSTTW